MRRKGTRKTSVLSAVGLAAALLAQASAALGQGTAPGSDPAALVRSDGKRTGAPEAGIARSSSSFGGTGVQSPVAGPSRERSIPPVSAPQGRESIIGFDERTPVNSPTVFPGSAVVLIVFSAGRCSGWMSGPDTVVTAGHCVSPGDGSFYPVASYAVYPGYTGASAPFGVCGVADMVTTAGFLNTGDERYDYGVLKLNCNVGLNTGWMGFFTKTTSFNGAPAAVRGYPGDKPYTQWKSRGTITYTGTLMLFYPNDTTGGMSGGPVFRLRPPGLGQCEGYCVYAIHTQGPHDAYPHGTFNHAVRISPDVYNTLLVTLVPSYWG